MMNAGQGNAAMATHRMRIRVYYEDTDAGGIVYHANYLKFAERARTELLRLHGAEQEALRRADGVSFTVRTCRIDYRAPARLDDLVEIRTTLHELRGARADARQCIHRVVGDRAEDQWLVRLDLVIACINRHGRPIRWPAPIRSALASLQAADSRNGFRTANGTDSR